MLSIRDLILSGPCLFFISSKPPINMEEVTCDIQVLSNGYLLSCKFLKVCYESGTSYVLFHSDKPDRLVSYGSCWRDGRATWFQSLFSSHTLLHQTQRAVIAIFLCRAYQSFMSLLPLSILNFTSGSVRWLKKLKKRMPKASKSNISQSF